MDEFYIQWHITNLCNLRCKHCYQDIFSAKDDLPWEKEGSSSLQIITENLLSTSRKWKKKLHITVTGGEPLLKKETFLLLDYLNSKDEVSELSLITNGLLINNEICQRLERSDKLKKIKISLDGASEKTNDSIRGMHRSGAYREKGTFSKIMKAIETIKKISHLEVIIMFTVMKSNLQELEDIFALCKEFQLDGLMVERFIPLGQGVSIEEQILDKEEWKSLANTLLGLCQINSTPEEILPYRAFQIKFNSQNLELLGAPCTAGIDGLCIMPDGIVYPCRRFNLPVGNLLEQPLSEIWQNSEVLKKIREKNNLQGKCRTCLIEECLGMHQSGTCRGCRALAYALTGNYLAEDTQCWLDESDS